MLKFLKKSDMNMTEGNILSQLLRFSVPLLLGNLFQQLYNTVDTYVVGHFVSTDAFAAVGSIGPIINTLIGFFAGLSTGAGVVVSQYYGAGDEKNVHETVKTAFSLTLVMAGLFTVAGLIGVPYALDLMNTPAEVYGEAFDYLTIYFSGVAGLMIYNFGAGVLRAVGDSTKPFIFLVISALLNVALDLLFVIVFGMGVAGVAWATVISQFVSAIIVLITLTRAKKCYALPWLENCFNGEIFRKIFKVGMPAALQMAITSFSNIFVQSYINFFGTNAMAGWTAYAKIDQFAMLPMMSISLSSTTFVGQNLGAGKLSRAKQGIKYSLLLAGGMTVLCIIPIMIFAPELVTFFNPDPDVLPYGVMILQLLSPFYVLCCVNQILAGALRGAGDARAPMVIMLCSFVLFRQVYLYLVSKYVGSLVWVALGYPAGWLLCSTAIFIYFKFSRWEKHRVVQHTELE